MYLTASPHGSKKFESTVATSLNESTLSYKNVRSGENMCHFTPNNYLSVEKWFLWMPSLSLVTVVVLIH